MSVSFALTLSVCVLRHCAPNVLSCYKQISMSIAMVSEQREVNQILKELLTAEGNEL